MSRKASPETQLRAAKSRMCLLEKQRDEARNEVVSLRAKLAVSMEDATTWRARFDKLLERDTRHGVSGA